jgi:hypothetical protein
MRIFRNCHQETISKCSTKSWTPEEYELSDFQKELKCPYSSNSTTDAPVDIQIIMQDDVSVTDIIYR